MGITRVTIWVIGLRTYLLSSPDPPSKGSPKLSPLMLGFRVKGPNDPQGSTRYRRFRGRVQGLKAYGVCLRRAQYL